MSRRKPFIPAPTGLGQVERVLRPIKETLDLLTGTEGGELSPVATDLATTATTAEIVARVNAIAEALNTLTARLNSSGT